jgi:hypothetical protein
MRLRLIALVLVFSFGVPAGAKACVGGTSPMTQMLYQNVPNPFNPTTRIPYMLERSTRVVIGVYDVSGARVARLDQGLQSPGTHAVTWNGRDAAGHALPSGVYFYRFEGFARSPLRKMVLLK